MLNKIKLLVVGIVLSLSLFPALSGVSYAKCGTTETRFIKCDSASEGDKNAAERTIGQLFEIGILAMSILIGIVATGGIAYAAVLYASARDSEAQVEQSKTIIRNIAVGLLLYVLMIAIVDWLVPGGVIE